MIDPNNPDYANTPASARRPAYAYAPAELYVAYDRLLQKDEEIHRLQHELKRM